MQTLTWEGTEFGNFILIASIHLRGQSIENFMSSSPLGCDFVTSPMFRREPNREREEIPLTNKQPQSDRDCGKK